MAGSHKPEASKWSYKELEDDDEDRRDILHTNGLLPKSHWYSSVRFQMTVLAALGVASAILHHYFCTRMNGKRVDTSPIPGLKFSEQALVGALGNAIASAACFFFGTAVGLVFAQCLWVSLRRKAHSVRQIEAILECRTSPFTPGSWTAWHATWKLTLLAVLSAAMAGVTIFAPSALRTASYDYAYRAPCTVPVVDMSTGDFGTALGTTWTPSQAVKKMSLTNLIMGELIPPISPCGSCAYDVVFNGPGMNCSNATDAFPFEYITEKSSSKYVIIWNGTHTVASGGNTILVATTTGYQQDYEAVTCDIFNATYNVHIRHNNSLSSVDVKAVTFNEPITAYDMHSTTPGDVGMYTISLSLAQHLHGIGMIDAGKMIAVQTDSQNHNIFYSALGSPGPTNSGRWKWRASMLEALPQLMQNVSISMLSNPLGGSEIATETECQYSTVFYDYNTSQLAITYGIATFSTIMCIVIGFWAIRRNRIEENMGFSRILASALNQTLYETALRGRPVLDENTRLRAAANASGHLEPA